MNNVVPSKRFLTVLICLGVIVGAPFFAYRFYPFKTVGNGDASDEDQTDDPSSLFISTEEMLSDYDYMWAVLEDQFPFFEAAEQNGYFAEKGIDKEHIKEKFRKQIEDLTQIDDDTYLSLNLQKNAQETMMDIFLPCINSFKGLGHLRIRSYEQAVYEGKTISEKELAFYSNLTSEKAEYSQNQKSSGKKSADTQEAIDISGNIDFGFTGDIPIITFKSFGDGFSQDYEQKAAEAVDRFCLDNFDSNDIIIDVRGNHGGNSYIWMYGLKSLLYKNLIPYKVIGGIKEECLPFLQDNNKDYKIYPVNPTAGDEAYQDIGIASAAKSADLDYIVTTTSDPDRYPRRSFNGKRYSGHLWLLVDGESLSSSDMLARDLKESSCATVIGTRTGGTGGVGVIPIFKKIVLPNSGLSFEFKWVAVFNDDGTFNDLTGTTPDIETDRDALEVCLEKIRNNSGK